MESYIVSLIAGIVSMILGALWYSPLMFGNIWIKLSGFKEKDIEKAKQQSMAKYYFAGFVASYITALVLSNFIEAGNIREGLIAGFMIWLGFIATTQVNGVLWEGKPVKLFVLNTAYSLVSLLLMALVLTSLI